MNKSDLVNVVSDETGVTKADAERTLNVILDAIKGSAEDGVQLVGFGSFTVSERKARVGRNPRTGEAINIDASKTIKFKPGTAFKDLYN